MSGKIMSRNPARDSFFTAVLAIAVPVALQSMLQSSFSMVDQVMVGQLGGGIVRSGGQTKYIMAIDMAGTWLVGVPLAFITAFVLWLPIFWVYLILSQEETVRLAITIWMFRTRKWMDTIA